MTIDEDCVHKHRTKGGQYKAMSVPMSAWSSASEPMDLTCSVPAQRSSRNTYPESSTEPLDLSTARSPIMQYPGIRESYGREGDFTYSSGYGRKSRSQHECDRHSGYYQNEFSTPQRGSCRYAGNQWSGRGGHDAQYWNDPSKHWHDVHDYDCSYRETKRNTTTPMFVAYPLTGTDSCYSPHTQYTPRYSGEAEGYGSWHTEGVPQKWIATEYSFPEMSRTRAHTNGGSCRYSTEVDIESFHNAGRRVPYRTDSRNYYVNDAVFQNKRNTELEEGACASVPSPSATESHVQISHSNHLTGGTVKSNVEGLGVEETLSPECLPPINIPLSVFQDIASKVTKQLEKSKDTDVISDISNRLKDFSKKNKTSDSEFKTKDSDFAAKLGVFNKKKDYISKQVGNGAQKDVLGGITVKQEPISDDSS